jgi:hypothetical protein
MTEHSIADSFIVRLYRFDTDDQRKLAGLVEAMDGSGERQPFTDIEELTGILNSFVRKQRKGRRSAKTESKRG